MQSTDLDPTIKRLTISLSKLIGLMIQKDETP